jgi:hypothetical protein
VLYAKLIGKVVLFPVIVILHTDGATTTQNDRSRDPEHDMRKIRKTQRTHSLFMVKKTLLAVNFFPHA